MTHILVVDDDRSQAEEFGVLLRNAGCDVTLVDNGQEALELLGRDLVDVVLSDLDMPEMDGPELVQAIHRDHPALPVILRWTTTRKATASPCGKDTRMPSARGPRSAPLTARSRSGSIIHHVKTGACSQVPPAKAGGLQLGQRVMVGPLLNQVP